MELPPTEIYSPETSDGVPYGSVMPFFLLAAVLAVFIGRALIVPHLSNVITDAYAMISVAVIGFLVIAPIYDPKEQVGPSSAYGCIGWATVLWEIAWSICQTGL